MHFVHRSVYHFLTSPGSTASRLSEDLSIYFLNDKTKTTNLCGNVCTTYLNFDNFGTQLVAQDTVRVPFNSAVAIQSVTKSIPFVNRIQIGRKYGTSGQTQVRVTRQPDRNSGTDTYHFLDYAKTYWPYHTKEYHECDKFLPHVDSLVHNINSSWGFQPWAKGTTSISSKYYQRALQYAILQDHDTIFRLVIDSTVFKNCHDGFQRKSQDGELKLVQLASFYGRLGFLKNILQLDSALAGSLDANGNTLLHFAVQSCNIKKVHMLCRMFSANAWKENDENLSSFDIAAANDQVHLLEVFLDNGVGPGLACVNYDSSLRSLEVSPSDRDNSWIVNAPFSRKSSRTMTTMGLLTAIQKAIQLSADAKALRAFIFLSRLTMRGIAAFGQEVSLQSLVGLLYVALSNDFSSEIREDFLDFLSTHVTFGINYSEGIIARMNFMDVEDEGIYRIGSLFMGQSSPQTAIKMLDNLLQHPRLLFPISEMLSSHAAGQVVCRDILLPAIEEAIRSGDASFLAVTINLDQRCIGLRKLSDDEGLTIQGLSLKKIIFMFWEAWSLAWGLAGTPVMEKVCDLLSSGDRASLLSFGVGMSPAEALLFYRKEFEAYKS